jgi:pyruvate kinase
MKIWRFFIDEYNIYNRLEARFFEFVHNDRKRGKALLLSLLPILLKIPQNANRVKIHLGNLMKSLATEKIELPQLETLLIELVNLRLAIINEGQAQIEEWGITIPEKRKDFEYSVSNLAYYLAFRQRDLRHLQTSLSLLGLSSLGRIEGHVIQHLDAVIFTLARLCGEEPNNYHSSCLQSELSSQKQYFLENETELVFGKTPLNRRVRMMVTLGIETAHDPELVRQMVASGMNIARINCAHDSANEWLKMVANVRRAEQKTGFECKISMDLGGPKSRTGG